MSTPIFHLARICCIRLVIYRQIVLYYRKAILCGDNWGSGCPSCPQEQRCPEGAVEKGEIPVEENDKVLREAGENYLEAILKLEDENQHVRSIDVASELGVSRPSVNKALGVLKKIGMVEQQPYGSISLTTLGREKAKAVMARHITLKGFLINVLGVDPETADNDACKMEHVVSEQTMDRLTSFCEELTREKSSGQNP